jgi:hypothetical protein
VRGARMREPARILTAPSSGRGAAAVLLWAVMVPIAVVGYGAFVLRAFSFDGCEGDCLPIASDAYRIFPGVIVVPFVVAIVVGVVLAVRRRSPIWAPVTGLALLLLTFTGMGVATEIGFAPMYERNARIARGEITPTPAPLPDPVGRWGTGLTGDPELELAGDGTLRGTDGCNDLAGSWRQGADGIIHLDWAPTSSRTCPDITVWFGRVERVEIRDGYMMAQRATGDTVGGLPSLR